MRTFRKVIIIATAVVMMIIMAGTLYLDWLDAFVWSIALHNSHAPGTIASSKDSLKFLARTFCLILWNFTTIGLVLFALTKKR